VYKQSAVEKALRFLRYSISNNLDNPSVAEQIHKDFYNDKGHGYLDRAIDKAYASGKNLKIATPEGSYPTSLYVAKRDQYAKSTHKPLVNKSISNLPEKQLQKRQRSALRSIHEEVLLEVHESDATFLQRMKELFLKETYGMMAPQKAALVFQLYMRIVGEGDYKTKANAVAKADAFVRVIDAYAQKHEPALLKELGKYYDKETEYGKKAIADAADKIKKIGRVATPSNTYSANPEPHRTSKHPVKGATASLSTQDFKKRVELTIKDHLKNHKG
jgi:hypothetical protein